MDFEFTESEVLDGFEGSDALDDLDDMELVMDYIASNPLQFVPLGLKKSTRVRPLAKDYWKTPWGIMLQDPDARH